MNDEQKPPKPEDDALNAAALAAAMQPRVLLRSPPAPVTPLPVPAPTAATLH